jgi:hypothetical protein
VLVGGTGVSVGTMGVGTVKGVSVASGARVMRGVALATLGSKSVDVTWTTGSSPGRNPWKVVNARYSPKTTTTMTIRKAKP